MKISKQSMNQGLTRKQLRAIETELGVFLDQPGSPLRTASQQFGVYDEDEAFVGDVCAKELLFTEKELKEAINDLFVTLESACMDPKKS